MATTSTRTRITYSAKELHDALQLVEGEAIVYAFADAGGLIIETERPIAVAPERPEVVR